MHQEFDNRYILIYVKRDNELGFVFFDISILHFYVGSFTDDDCELK